MPVLRDQFIFPSVIRFVFLLSAVIGILSIFLVTVGGRLLYRPGDVVAVTSIWPHGDLFILDIPRQILRNLTHSAPIERGVRWSPDGERLAFISGNYEIYTIGFSGGNHRRLVKGTAFTRGIAWSHDGQSIYFTASESGPPSLHYLASEGGKIQTVETPPLAYHDMAWSPDGQRLTFASVHEGDHEVYVMDWGSSRVRRLTGRRTVDVSPVWSPDGQAIAFMSVRSGFYEIDIINLESGVVQPINRVLGPVRTPAWVGTSIIYASGRRIYAVDIDGYNHRELANVGFEITTLAVRP